MSGGLADVFKGLLNEQSIALKRLRINVRGRERDDLHRKFLKESLIWRQLKHKNILPFMGVDRDTFQDIKALAMVSPWMECGTIMEFIKSDNYDPQSDRQRLMVEVGEGLYYLHSQGMAHGDVHGSNIFITDRCSACLADFGLTIISDATLTHVPTTMEVGGAAGWLAPEALSADTMEARKTFAGDIFAFGRLCWALFARRSPFHDTPAMRVIMLIMQDIHPPRPTNDNGGECSMSDSMWCLVNECWAAIPGNRPQLSDILKRLTEGTALLDKSSLSPTLVGVDKNTTNEVPESAAYGTAVSDPRVFTINELSDPSVLKKALEGIEYLGEDCLSVQSSFMKLIASIESLKQLNSFKRYQFRQIIGLADSHSSSRCFALTKLQRFTTLVEESRKEASSVKTSIQSYQSIVLEAVVEDLRADSVKQEIDAIAGAMKKHKEWAGGIDEEFAGIQLSVFALSSTIETSVRRYGAEADQRLGSMKMMTAQLIEDLDKFNTSRPAPLDALFGVGRQCFGIAIAAFVDPIDAEHVRDDDSTLVELPIPHHRTSAQSGLFRRTMVGRVYQAAVDLQDVAERMAIMSDNWHQLHTDLEKVSIWLNMRFDQGADLGTIDPVMYSKVVNNLRGPTRDLIHQLDRFSKNELPM